MFSFILGVYLGVSLPGHTYGDSMCNRSGNRQAVFYRSCTTLPSHQHYMRAPISPHPGQPLSLSVFWITAILVGVKWHFIVVFICIS